MIFKQRRSISLIQAFTALLTGIVLCLIFLSLISSRGIDRVGEQFTELSTHTFPLALTNAQLTKNVLQQVKLMNEGLQANKIETLEYVQNSIEERIKQANINLDSLSLHKNTVTRKQHHQLKQYLVQLTSQSSQILTIQKETLTINDAIDHSLQGLRYGLSSIGPEMNRISQFLISNNSDADDAANRFVASAMALETTFLMLMAEEKTAEAKRLYKEIYNRISALELAFDDLSQWYPDINSYMSLMAPLDIVFNELKSDHSIPHFILTKLSLIEQQNELINTASTTSLSIIHVLDAISLSAETKITQDSQWVVQAITEFKHIIVVISVILIITVWISAFLIRRWTTKGLNNIITHLKQLSEHNYQHSIPELGPKEMQLIAGKLNKVINSTTDSVKNMSRNCDVLYQTSEITKEVSNEIEQGLTQQNDSLGAMASIVTQLESSINDIAQLTQESHSETSNATQAANLGLTVLHTNNERLTHLNDALSKNVNAMNTLDVQVDKIRSMVSVIANLAENTNLLALNAAIEAARAGEQGRGFAVVADEVRKLAGNTSEQTNNIRNTMQSLLAAAEEAKSAVLISQSEMTLALESSMDVSTTFEQISTTINHISDRVSQVSVATEEQAYAATEVTNNINHINEQGKTIELQLSAFVESTEEVANIASQQQQLLDNYRLN
ncbi:methyl-accepting chemotaxis protein [Aliivibrio logei]|uniref:Chemotaxis protein n=1 Tax=Aliivibrio logei TaxID=688 RepID=A0A1B9NZJ8_ALILO|nr:methyl-accepting chemotaxis protein [Aliivibrio logei]OCH21533.1 hypothetical protein A6E04_06595 [Aliivibrio logei]